MITLKTPAEIAVMRKASRIVAEILEELAAHVRPGITTEELDRLSEELTLKKGARPAFKVSCKYSKSAPAAARHGWLSSKPKPASVLTPK